MKAAQVYTKSSKSLGQNKVPKYEKQQSNSNLYEIGYYDDTYMKDISMKLKNHGRP